MSYRKTHKTSLTNSKGIDNDINMNKILNSKSALNEIPFFKRIYDQLYYRYEVINTKKLSSNQFYKTFTIIQKAFANSPISDHDQFFGEYVRKKFGNDSFMILNYTANLLYCYIKYFYDKLESKILGNIICVAPYNKEPLQFYLKCHKVALKLFGLNSLNECFQNKADFLAFSSQLFNDKTNDYGKKIWTVLQNEKDLLWEAKNFNLDASGIADRLLQYFTGTNKISLSYILEYIFNSYLPTKKRLIHTLYKKLNINDVDSFKNNLSKQSRNKTPILEYRRNSVQSIDPRNHLSTSQSRFHSKSIDRLKEDSQANFTSNTSNLYNKSSPTTRKLLQVVKDLRQKKQQVSMLAIIMQHMEELRSGVMVKIEECLYDFENIKRSHDLKSGYGSYQNVLDQSKGDNMLHTYSGYDYFSDGFAKNSQADKENLHYKESIKKSDVENQKKLKGIWEKLSKNYESQYFYIKKNSEPFKELFNTIKRKYPTAINSKIGKTLLANDIKLKTLRNILNNKIMPDQNLFLRIPNFKTSTADENLDGKCDDCGGLTTFQEAQNESEPEDDHNKNTLISSGKHDSYDRKSDRQDSEKYMHKISESFGEEESSEAEIRNIYKDVRLLKPNNLD